jgi:uncharacterized membrane protein YeiH
MFLVLDAIGLVVFTILGCNVALGLGLPAVVVIVSGMVTGCLGGVLRDILCNDVPLLFRSELYASVSVVTGAFYASGLGLGLPREVVVSVSMPVGLSLRLLALRYNWNMPGFVYKAEWH